MTNRAERRRRERAGLPPEKPEPVDGRATIAPTAREVLDSIDTPAGRKARDELALLEDSLRGAIATILAMQQRADQEIPA